MTAKFRKMTADEPVVPVPQDSDEFPVHFLANKWVFWYLIPNRSGTAPSGLTEGWNQYLHPLHSFQTIEDFGRILNSVEPPAKLLKWCRYYVAREEVKPIWEDPAMQSGHFLTAEVDKEPDRSQEIEAKWIDIVLAAIGDDFPCSDAIMAVEYVSRPNTWRISIWVGSACDDDGVNEIAQKMETLLVDLKVEVQGKPSAD